MIYKAGSTSHGKHFQTCPVTKTFCISLRGCDWDRHHLYRHTDICQKAVGYAIVRRAHRLFCWGCLSCQITLWFTGEASVISSAQRMKFRKDTSRWRLLPQKSVTSSARRMKPRKDTSRWGILSQKIPYGGNVRLWQSQTGHLLPGRLSSASSVIVWKLLL